MKETNSIAQEIKQITALSCYNQQEPITPESRRDMRSLAFHFIYAVDRFDYTIPTKDLIEKFKAGFKINIADDSLAVTMATEVIAHKDELHEQIKPLLKNWKFERLGCCTRIILSLAIWELQQPETIPSVAINEAIELAKNFAEKDAYKFVNGILDEASKTLTGVTSLKGEQDELAKESRGTQDNPNE